MKKIISKILIFLLYVLGNAVQFGGILFVGFLLGCLFTTYGVALPTLLPADFPATSNPTANQFYFIVFIGILVITSIIAACFDYFEGAKK